MKYAAKLLREAPKKQGLNVEDKDWDYESATKD